MRIHILVAIVIAVVVFLFIFGRAAVKEISILPTFFMWDIIYTDTSPEKKREGVTYGSILRCEKYALQGKPDYIYRHKFTKELMIVEIKSGITDEIHNGDMLQLGVYMLIVESIYHKKPKKGIIKYKNKGYVVRNTHMLREKVLDAAYRMRKMLETSSEVANSSFANCRHCVCDGTVCEYSANLEILADEEN